ncbi:MAG: hypothetical protein SCJ94_04565 [Bacillota bacterium]|nr:hypothetical protein [Bacillota bacterium]MDW7729264.1 hypothetical protein [Bacillota bacterium]
MHKHSKVRLFTLISLLIILSLTIAGCGKTSDKVAENIIEESIKAESGEDVDIDLDTQSGEVTITTSEGEVTAKTGGGMDWPENIPDYVPRFEGNIVMVMQTGEPESFYYSIAYENINDPDPETFAETLLNSGWKIQMKTEMEDSWIINAVYDEKVLMTTSVNTEENTGAIMLNKLE